MKTHKISKLIRLWGYACALSFFAVFLVSVFAFLSPVAFADTLFGKDGWVLFHTDEEGTKYYYDENSVVAIGDARSAKYIGVYSTPKGHSYTYGYVVDAQVKCGLIFYKYKSMSMQPFGKGGPDDLQFNPTPPDDEFRRARKGSAVYHFAQTVCKAM